MEPFDVFESVPSGEDWRQTIKEAIRGADGFILLVGAPEVTASSRAGYELGIAETLGNPILVLLSHNRAASEPPVGHARASSYSVRSRAT